MLTGSAYPSQKRILILARWLNVSPMWLRYGEGDERTQTAANDFTQLPLDEVLILNEFRRLDERSQEVVRELIASLLKHHSLRT